MYLFGQFSQSGREISIMHLYREFCSLFEAKSLNLIFNSNPFKYVGDLELNKVNLAEDPSYESTIIYFNG